MLKIINKSVSKGCYSSCRTVLQILNSFYKINYNTLSRIFIVKIIKHKVDPRVAIVCVEQCCSSRTVFTNEITILNFEYL